MSMAETFFRYTGGVVALAGVATSAAFIGRRTRDPVATLIWDPLPLWIKITGIVTGLLVMVVGLAIYGRLGSRELTG